MAGNIGYTFECRTCGGPNRRAFKFCPWCGVEVQVPNDHINGRRFTIDSFRLLLQPLIDSHGYVWMANRIGIDESNIRHVLNRQNSVSEKVAEKWLIKLGIEMAIHDGTLVPFHSSSKVPQEPVNKYFEE